MGRRGRSGHVPEACAHLHGHAEALVEGEEAAALGDLGEAVEEAGELARPGLAQVSGQPRTRKVQRVHDQQGTSTGQATCAHMLSPSALMHGPLLAQHYATLPNSLRCLTLSSVCM